MVFHSVPPEGLLLGAMALSVAHNSAKDAKEETVLLLRRRRRAQAAPPGLFEAELNTISANAAVWNAKQILEHGLRLSGYATMVEPLTTRAKYQAKIYTKMSEEAIRRADPRRRSLSKLLKKSCEGRLSTKSSGLNSSPCHAEKRPKRPKRSLKRSLTAKTPWKMDENILKIYENI